MALGERLGKIVNDIKRMPKAAIPGCIAGAAVLTGSLIGTHSTEIQKATCAAMAKGEDLTKTKFNPTLLDHEGPYFLSEDSLNAQTKHCQRDYQVTVTNACAATSLRATMASKPGVVPEYLGGEAQAETGTCETK